MTPTQPKPTRSARLWLLLTCAAVLVIAGCSSLPSTPPASIDRAARLASQGDHAGAAQMYAQLSAANAPPEGVTLGFSAVREWLAAGKPDEAQSALSAIATTSDPALTLERSLLDVEVTLARGQSAEAWRRAALIPAPRSTVDQRRVLLAQQHAASAAGRPLDIIRTGMALDGLAASDADRQAVRRDLLAQLRSAAEHGVKLEPQASKDPQVRGWLELGSLAANAARSPLTAGRDIQRWRTRYPGHPGNTIAMTEVIGSNGPTTLSSAAGTQVAVLLPLSGRQSAPGQMVRDGFMAAVNQLPQEQRPLVKFYDTNESSAGAALASAQADGSAFIVGPLTREEAVAVVAENTRHTPLLLLNALPGEEPTPANVWQFALSPEDEARLVARRALAAGQRRAIVIAPTGDWGTRVMGAFREEYIAGGGSVLVQTTYDPTRNEFTDQITAALRIDESQARHKRIEQIVGGKLAFEARRRADIDMIFAAGQAIALRQIRPQLRYFYAGDVPTYMTSDGFDPDPGANRDIDGLMFPDMPWMLQESGPVADTRTATQAAWADRGPRLPRFFAFGYDAGQLMLALRSPSWRWPLAGVTGRLTLDDRRHFHRELDWAQIHNGTPRPLGVPES